MGDWYAAWERVAQNHGPSDLQSISLNRARVFQPPPPRRPDPPLEGGLFTFTGEPDAHLPSPEAFGRERYLMQQEERRRQSELREMRRARTRRMRAQRTSSESYGSHLNGPSSQRRSSPQRRTPPQRRSPAQRRTPTQRRSPTQRRNPTQRRTPSQTRSPPQAHSPSDTHSTPQTVTPSHTEERKVLPSRRRTPGRRPRYPDDVEASSVAELLGGRRRAPPPPPSSSSPPRNGFPSRPTRVSPMALEEERVRFAPRRVRRVSARRNQSSLEMEPVPLPSPPHSFPTRPTRVSPHALDEERQRFAPERVRRVSYRRNERSDYDPGVLEPVPEPQPEPVIQVQSFPSQRRTTRVSSRRNQSLGVGSALGSVVVVRNDEQAGFSSDEGDANDNENGNVQPAQGEWQLDDFSYESLLDLSSMKVKTGLTGQDMERLPMFVLSEKTRTRMGGDDEEMGTCCICLCDYEMGNEIISLPCNHCFHSTCVKKWLSESDKCPMCRAEVPKSRVM